MKYSTLKKTNLRISQYGLGTNAIGGHNLFADLNEQDGVAMLEEALELGVTFIDTADVYGLGRSEELVGQVLGKRKRDSYVLATKGGSTPQGPINDPSYMREALEKSLKRLNIDVVDLYYVHKPDGTTPLAETIGELSRMKEEGKIQAIGVSNLSLEQLKEANSTCEISALQSPYSMLEREAENDLLPYCVKHGISFIPYGPLTYGILGGQYTSGFKLNAGDWRNRLTIFQPEHFNKALHKVEQLKVIAANKQTTISNLALAWLLAQDGVDAIIPGGKTPEHVRRNISAVDLTFTEEELNDINHILNT